MDMFKEYGYTKEEMIRLLNEAIMETTKDDVWECLEIVKEIIEENFEK